METNAQDPKNVLDQQPPGIVELVSPGSFEPEQHFYTRVLNASIHPLVSYFLQMSSERIVARYCHLNPQVDRQALIDLLWHKPRYLRWSGADLFHVTTADGKKNMVLIETNSSPSGQKSMPLFAEHEEQGGYRFLISYSFKPALEAHRFRQGALAVLYDKNYMEASGYAAVMADVFKEKVFLVPMFDGDLNPPTRFNNRVLEVRSEDGQWHPIRGAFRYVTQRPWSRIPINSKTLIFNSTLGCIAGGRNKMVAAMAYDVYNGELSGTGLSILMPETIRDINKNEIPLMVRQFGGHAVIKIPYSNAGQGVYTITSDEELEDFMAIEHKYEKFIVQSLIGNYKWSSEGSLGKFYHVGTVPNKSNKIFVADVRMMVGAGPDGFKPIAIYGRRANAALDDVLEKSVNSWDMLGTNLSVKRGENKWDSETNRLLLMDRRDFNRLGVGLDDLIQGFIQTVLSTVAIDRMATTLINKKGGFRKKLFASINPDPVLLSEVME